MTDPRTVETLPAPPDEGPCACGSYACMGGDLCPAPPDESERDDVRPLCTGCGSEIDPDCCGCGMPRDDHSGWDGHFFVPMGCNCYRDESERDEVLAADPHPPGPCEGCGAPRMDWSSECDCDDVDVAPSWEEDWRSARRAQGGW